MIVKKLPGKQTHTFMAVLKDENTIIHEDGKEYRIEDVPKQTRIWSHWKRTVEGIWKEKKIGEVLVYDQEPVRWRKESKYEDHYWPSVGNNQDVYIMKNDGFPEDLEEALKALCDWRNWIEEYGGNAFGTVASVSWSLWRATFTEDFISPKEGLKAVPFPVGGRLVPCRELNSAWIGDFVQWDLQAAYARELSKIRFGGKGSSWKKLRFPEKSDYRTIAAGGIPVYVRARVWVPRMEFGPLPRRRLKYSPFTRVPIQYNTNARVHGTWTIQEIDEAIAVGCSVTIEDVWVHVPTGKQAHFADWWEIIREGRDHLYGFSKSLAKSTGNSLWGQFALRERPRKIRWINDEGRRKHRVIQGRLTNRPGSPELSDTLTGIVRSKLYRFMMSSGDLLMQANTDGAWITEDVGFRPPDEWRIKKRATMMEFIDESNYRFWNPEVETWEYVMSGIPVQWQEMFFTAAWKKLEQEKRLSYLAA